MTSTPFESRHARTGSVRPETGEICIYAGTCRWDDGAARVEGPDVFQRDLVVFAWM